MMPIDTANSAFDCAGKNRSTIRSALAEGVGILRAAGIDTAWLDAEVLLRQALGVERARLYLDFDSPLSPEDKRKYRRLLLRRWRREPLAYILARKEFWSLDFLVTPDVLIPRPETERLIEIALRCALQVMGKTSLRVLDLGTGSGVIPICLSKEMREAELWAVDVSAQALAVAAANGRRHGVAEQIRLLCGDLFEPLPTKREYFDLIVSNPPYIRSDELRELAPEVRDWEPLTALDGGGDGLDYYRRIVAQAGDYLAPGGWLVMETGADMAAEVAGIFAAAGSYAPAAVYQDYAGKDRVIATAKLAAAQGGNKDLSFG